MKQPRVTPRTEAKDTPDSSPQKWLGQLIRSAGATSPAIRSLARPLALVAAGMFVAFDDNHGNRVGLWWVFVVSVISLAVRNDSKNMPGQIAWWTHSIFAAATLLGLAADTMSPESSLSLTIALVAFEAIRAALRGEYLASFGSAALVVALTVIVTITDTDTRHATGVIGVWAIVVGIFTTIQQIDVLTKRHKKEATRGTK